MLENFKDYQSKDSKNLKKKIITTLSNKKNKVLYPRIFSMSSFIEKYLGIQ